jgi:IS30 family transposase
MEKSFYRYANRYNNIPKKILNFKTPNEIVSEFNFKDIA